LEPLPESDKLARFRIVLSIDHQHADAPHLVGLLRVRRERPCRRRATEERDEVAASHLAPKPGDRPVNRRPNDTTRRRAPGTWK